MTTEYPKRTLAAASAVCPVCYRQYIESSPVVVVNDKPIIVHADCYQRAWDWLGSDDDEATSGGKGGR